MLKKGFGLKVKSVDAGEGTFEGILSAYGVEDLGNDVVMPGSFSRSLSAKGNVIPLLWQHRPDEPIGTLVLQDSPGALKVRGKLLLGLPTADKAYELIKAGVIGGLSIGFDVIRQDVKNGIRYLTELRLWEGSIVTFPMNEMAMITNVKQADLPDENDDDDELVALQAIFDSLERLGNVLKP
jgi:HK97 family phage prohead protease